MDIHRMINTRKFYFKIMNISFYVFLYKLKQKLFNGKKHQIIFSTILLFSFFIFFACRTLVVNSVIISERNYFSLLFEEQIISNSKDIQTGPTPVSYLNYTIQPGDSLHSLAKVFNLDEVTILKINNLSNASRIFSGSRIRIPNQDGIICKVDTSNTLEKISEKYKVEKDELIKINSLKSESGISEIFIPGIHFDGISKSLLLGEYFRMPLYGRITSYFGFRRDPINKLWLFHKGVDIAKKAGTRIVAAGAGQVIFTGWTWPLGNTIKIRHQNGFVTIYGHLQKISVKNYTWVNYGSIIGLVGSTGRSSGAHLHYEVRQYGRLINPFSVTLY